MRTATLARGTFCSSVTLPVTTRSWAVAGAANRKSPVNAVRTVFFMMRGTRLWVTRLQNATTRRTAKRCGPPSESRIGEIGVRPRSRESFLGMARKGRFSGMARQRGGTVYATQTAAPPVDYEVRGAQRNVQPSLRAATHVSEPLRQADLIS